MMNILAITKNVILGFRKDICYLRASALSYYTLLSIVPVLAVAFGIAKGFGFEKILQQEITERFHEYPEVVDKLITFAYSLLEHTKGGLIAGIGVVFLFWVVFNLLSNIENSMNAIWDVPKPRNFLRKLSDYLAMMILGPILLTIISSASLFVASKVTEMIQQNGIMEAISPVIHPLIRLAPLTLSWVLFTVIYLLMPNTKVPFRYGALAGIIAGTIFQFVQWIYFKFQIGVTSYGAIYGSFAAIPLFLIWMHMSWLIVLIGAEVAHSLQEQGERA